MELVADTPALAALCRLFARAPYVAVDTEFIRDRTYWPRLCLVQLAGPAEVAAVDTLSPTIDLDPLFRLLVDPGVLKVFHAARQDIEIFLHLANCIPAPLFDTQVAAMVCGFGDAVGYETLAAKLARARIDKSVRFTDWSRRPLSEKQLSYALADVTHLRVAYEKLAERLRRTGREDWVKEEMVALTDPASYRIDPEEAWRRLKPRSRDPRYLAVLRELAAWRERKARAVDVPRRRILKDEALHEIAAHPPAGVRDLARLRSLPKGVAETVTGAEILRAVERGRALPASERPTLPPPLEPAPGVKPLADLLRVLLKMKCEAHHVASKLVASGDDLEALAADDAAPVPALRGWRRKVFGEDALDLKRGRIALAAEGGRVRLVRIDEDPRLTGETRWAG